MRTAMRERDLPWKTSVCRPERAGPHPGKSKSEKKNVSSCKQLVTRDSKHFKIVKHVPSSIFSVVPSSMGHCKQPRTCPFSNLRPFLTPTTPPDHSRSPYFSNFPLIGYKNETFCLLSDPLSSFLCTWSYCRTRV